MARKFIFAGGPHVGKTTLLNGMRERMPDAHFVPEPAEILISKELAKQEQEADYTPILPTTHYGEFVHMVVGLSVELEASIPKESEVALLDRSIIDNIGYATLNGHHHLIPEMQRLVDAADYTAALLCDPVGTYTQTAVRPESEDFARTIHSHLVDAYYQSGVPVIKIPALGVDARLNKVESVIRNF
jgi:predicted ATPase